MIGETGHAGLTSVTGTFYVSADADEPVLEEIWQATLLRSPLYQTLSRCAAIEMRLQATRDQGGAALACARSKLVSRAPGPSTTDHWKLGG